jgi:hypothetical protein
MPITEETRKSIFNKLKKNLKKYTPPMVVKTDSDNKSFELIGNKEVPYGYDKKLIPGMYFASIAQRKDSVAFYFFPSYMNEKLKEVAPSLYKCLKGKTCFHFKKEEQVNEKELDALLKSGVKAWEKSGYMK